MTSVNPALAPIPAAPVDPAGPPNAAGSEAGAGGGAPDAKPPAAAPTGPEDGGTKPAAGLIPSPDATGGETKPEGDAKKPDPAEKPSEASGLAEGFGSKKPETPEGTEKPKADATGAATGDPAPIAINLPAGTIVPDQGAVDAFAAFAGTKMTTPLTQEQATEIVAHQLEQTAAAEAAGRAEWVKTAQTTNQTWEKQLLNDPDIGGGDAKKYAEATAVAQKGFRRFAGEGVAQYLIDLSGGQKDWNAGESVNLTLQPDLFKMFHELGKALGEDKSVDVGGGGSGTPDRATALASIYNHSSSQEVRDRLAKKG
jgi:hypothetical protein